MKKIVILIALLSAILSGTQSEVELDSQYKEALKSYKAKDFKNSYKILSKIYLSKLSDSKVNFFLGRSAFETGHYEMALAAFERVEMLDPANLANKVQMARTYFMLKMYEDSELAFEEVLENPNIPENLKTNIELYLSKVKKVQQKSFTYATINIDWIYDSNVNYGSLGGEYDTNYGAFPSNESSDRATQVYADLINIYDIGGKNAFAVKNRAKVYLKDYQKMNAYDVQYLAYTPSLLYKQTKFLGELTLDLNLLSVGKEEYLRTFSLSPRLEFNHTTALKSMTHLKYQRKFFTRDSDYDLNSDHYELEYALQSILSPRSYIRGKLKATTERKHHGSRIDVDYDEYRAGIVYAKQFTGTYGAEVSAEYRRRAYRDSATTVYSNKREDNAGATALTLNAKILKTLRFHVKGTYDRVESNQDVFTYQKYTLSAGINKTF
ncbi:MAG: hypothetical protein ACJAWW_002387 [Sulfurimonas sp.]|jgi:hypothetical protein